ncbi:Yip1 family protein [Metabacillus fastidiosus]|uniref:Yip1 family protein n=1 Tax=Metabacillus fastidiosus TaxID=1458 RepID=A0ABU6NZH2_9BACI|nr:Yip1 family protein [Metabacillus fastidiosus]MED4401777.1 Yip1 family protein [Metabacillus fastidiosus]MED4463415.1 Yip1 family protein [Metabacillus fastidiosus]
MTEVELSKNTVEKKPSLFGMIFSPSEQFERMREKPVILVPLIIVLITGLIMSVLVGLNVINYLPPMDDLGMSAEDLQMFQTITIASTAAITFFSVPVILLVMTLIYFAIAKIMKIEVTFKKMLSLNIFTAFIGLVGQVINLLIMAAIKGDPEVMLTSLNSLVGATGALGAVLSTFEIFSIWSSILLALGLHKVIGFSKKASWTIVIVFFIIGLIFAAVSGAANEMFEGMNQF